MKATWTEKEMDIGFDELKNFKFTSDCKWPSKESKVFDPRLMFMNAKEEIDRIDQEIKVSPWRMGPKGEPVIEYSFFGRGTFNEELELENFPFDVQPLRIVIGSLNPASIIGLNEDIYQGVNSQLRTEFLGIPEFEIDHKPYFDSFSKPFTGNQGQIFASLEIAVVASRIFTNYFWSIYVPSITITTMTGAAYTMPPDEISDRLSVTITLTLVMVAYKYLVASLLPRLKYLTFCDILVHGSFGFICMSVVQNVTACLVCKFHSLEVGIIVDIIFMLILGVLWVVFLTYIICLSVFAQREEQKKLAEFKEKENKKITLKNLIDSSLSKEKKKKATQTPQESSLTRTTNPLIPVEMPKGRESNQSQSNIGEEELKSGES